MTARQTLAYGVMSPMRIQGPRLRMAGWHDLFPGDPAALRPGGALAGLGL
jgi:hypothetical protein